MTAVRTEHVIQQAAPGQQKQNTAKDATLAMFEGHLEKALQASAEVENRQMSTSSSLMEDVTERDMDQPELREDREDRSADSARDADRSEDHDDAAHEDSGRDEDSRAGDDQDDRQSADDTSQDTASESDTAETADQGSTLHLQQNAQALDLLTADQDINVNAIIGSEANKDPNAILVDTGLIDASQNQAQQTGIDGTAQSLTNQGMADGMGAGDDMAGLTTNAAAQQLAGAQAAQSQAQAQNQALNATASQQSEQIDPVKMVLNTEAKGQAATTPAQMAAATQATAQANAAATQSAQQQALQAQAGDTMTQADFLLQQQQDAGEAGVSGKGKAFLESLINGKENMAAQNAQTAARAAGQDAALQPPHADAGRAQPQQGAITPENVLRGAPQSATSASALNTSTQTPQAQVAAQPQAPQPPQQAQGTTPTQQAQNPHSSQHAKASEQVALSIRRGVASGDDKITIRLDPPELGRVDVKLTLSAEGGVTAKIMANNQETLDLLRRDSRELERALKDAGLDANSENMEFELSKDDSSGFAHQAKDHEKSDKNRTASNDHDTLEDDDEPVTSTDEAEEDHHLKSSDHTLDLIA